MKRKRKRDNPKWQIVQIACILSLAYVVFILGPFDIAGTQNISKWLQSYEAQNQEALEIIQLPQPGLTPTASFPSCVCFNAS